LSGELLPISGLPSARLIFYFQTACLVH